MKKVLIIFSLLLFVFQTQLFAQIDSTKKEVSGKHMVFPKSIVSFFPFAFATSKLKVGYEYRLNNSLALKAAAFYGYDENYNYDESESFGGELMLKVHIVPETKWVNGLYIGPFAEYKSMNFTNYYYPYPNPYPTTTKYTANAAGFGFVFGYHLLLWNRLSMDYNMGGGIRIPSGSYRYADNYGMDRYNKGVFFKSTLSIGIGF